MIDSEKLLEQIDSRFQAFGVRLANYDSILNDIQGLKKYVEDLQKKYQESIGLLKFCIEQSKKYDQEHGKFSAYLKKLIDDHEEEIRVNKKDADAKIDSLEELRRDHHVLSGKCVISSEKIQDLASAKDQHDKQIKNISAKSQSLEDNHNVLSENLNQIRSSIPPLQAQIPSLLSNQGSMARDLKSLSDRVSSMRQEYADDLFRHRSEVASSLKNAENYIDSKIGLIQIPDVSGFVKKEDLDSYKNLLSFAQLDAKNAMAKSNNIEVQMQILSKKLEGVLIQLKDQEYANK